MEIHDTPQATPENELNEVRKILRELAERQVETDRQITKVSETLVLHERILNEKIAENAKQIKETERILNEKIAEVARNIDKVNAEVASNINKVNATVGSWHNNQGHFAEEYFFNSFANGKKNFLGEDFDDIAKSVPGFKNGAKDEYDILMVNGKSIAIVETKAKAHENDIPSVLKKAITFRINYPEYANHKIYLGLASLAFYPKLEQECIKEGIAIIKQAGNTVVINDAHLKAF